VLGAPPPGLAAAAALAAALGAQLLWLTPALALRAQHIIAGAVADPGAMSSAQRGALPALRRSVAAAPAPPAALHCAYVALELGKLGLLAALAVAQL
jgi:hypothetical protein